MSHEYSAHAAKSFDTDDDAAEEVAASLNLESGLSGEDLQFFEESRVSAEENIDEIFRPDEETIQVEALNEYEGDHLEVSVFEEVPVHEEGAGQDLPAPQFAPAAAPDTGAVAQAILIMTSLGSFRKQFYSSKRAQHFLDCKGVPYLSIDANRDVSQGAGLQDQEYINDWINQGILKTDKSQPASKFLLPQILFDGVTIGQEIDLQDLEEDGDLDWIIARASCPECLNERSPSDPACRVCGVLFQELVPESSVTAKRVQRYCRGLPYIDKQMSQGQHFNYNDIVQHAMPSAGAEYATSEALTYEGLFGEPPPEE